MVRRPFATRTTSEATYGSTLRLIGTIQKLKAVHANAVTRLSATVIRRYRTAVDPGATLMPSRSRAFWSATRPCSCSPAPASRRRAGLPDFRSPGGLWERLDPMVDGHVDMLSRDPARVWQCWAEPLVGASIAAQPRALRARAPRGGRLRLRRRDAEHRRPPPRRRQRRRRGARPPAHGALHALRRRGGDGARARALCRDATGARVPRLRRDAAAAGRALRRATARLGLEPRLRTRRELGRLPLRRDVAAGLPGGRARRGVRPGRAAARDRLARGDGALGVRRPPDPALRRGAPARRRGHTARRPADSP